MKVTEVRLNRVAGDSLVRAYAGIVLDGELALHDLKLLSGPRGTFLAMPTRKLTDRCLSCQTKNHLRAKYCNECAFPLSAPEGRIKIDAVTGRLLLHADVVHPISQGLRQHIEDRVLAAMKDFEAASAN